MSLVSISLILLAVIAFLSILVVCQGFDISRLLDDVEKLATELEQGTEKLKEATKLMAELCTLNDYYKDKLADKEKQLAAVREQLVSACFGTKIALTSLSRRSAEMLATFEEQTNGPDSPTT